MNDTATLRKRCGLCGNPFQLSGSGRAQKYCRICARRGIAQGRGLAASNPLKIKAAEKGFSIGIGPYVRAQIEAQKHQPNPISFTLPDGTRGKVWLASDKNGSRIIGDDRHWRLNVPAASRVDRDERNKRVTATLADIWQTELGFPPMGFRARVCIESEKELQALGCGWRIVICQFRGDKVVLHHNGASAKMKRAAFKRFIAANRAARPKLAIAAEFEAPQRKGAA